MSYSRQRIPNITPAEWTDKLLDIFEFMEGPEARVKGPKYNAVKALVHAPEVSLAYDAFPQGPHPVSRACTASEGTGHPACVVAETERSTNGHSIS